MYDSPQFESYYFPQVDFGAASDTVRTIAVPKGDRFAHNYGARMPGRVLAVIISNVTEDFVGSSTDGGVRVGDGSDDDTYVDTVLVLDETVDVGEELTLSDDGSQADIEADRTSLTVTFVATTGSPTGIADVTIEVEWY